MQATNLCARFSYDAYFQQIVQRLHNADYQVLVFTYQKGYIFDENQARSMDQKPLVILDFSEEGAFQSYRNTTILGREIYCQNDESTKDEYMRLNEWVSKQNIIAYFKREYSQALQKLHAETETDFPIYPIELISTSTIIKPITKDQWMSRLGNVFHLYGYSHNDRKLLHAALQVNHGHVINNLLLTENCKIYKQRFDLLEQVPHFARYPIHQIYNAQKEFLFSVSLPGCGVKCFRDSEACVNAIPIMADLNMKRAVPFTEENALLLPTQDGHILIDESVKKIDEALQNPEALYMLAVAANEAARQLEIDNYVSKFMNNHIKNHLFPRSAAVTNKIEKLEAHVEQSIEKALNLQSNIDPAVLAIKGFSTQTMRHFFNNLCALENATYLEVGAYYGGTACASISNNPMLKSIIIDDFSQPFGAVNPWPELIENLDRHTTNQKQTRFINTDCFGLKADDINASVDIYFYDGHHDEQFQARALPHFLDSLSEVFIHLVDDYNWESVRNGTAKAIQELEGKVLIEKQWIFETKGDDPIWHNGLLIAIMRKL